MDLIFELQKGRTFSIEVGFFDTVLEIKEKIQKYQRIPISKQTLIFNRQILQDDRDVAYCELLHNSRVHLLVAADPSDDQTTSSEKLHLTVNIPMSKMHVPLEIDPNDTVSNLKDKIQELETLPANRLILHSGGSELQDHRSLRECEVSDNAKIEASLRSSPMASPGGKNLKVTVLTRCGKKKIPVEVNKSENVGVLRKELQKLQKNYEFIDLPAEGYFFIYKQNVMDEDKSFRWHRVSPNETIEIFGGSVTAGS
ncbi:hypothetical protein UlMin_011386 [Ulmus minor]